MKRETKSQRWYFERIDEEFGYPAKEVIRGMYDAGTALRVIAGALEVPASTLMGWIRRFGWVRQAIGKDRPWEARERITEEWGHDAIALVCSDRKMGLKYREIGARYGITNPTIIRYLRIGAPHLAGCKIAPVQVSPPEISARERERRRLACIEHNRQMAIAKSGWFANQYDLFKRHGEG